MEPRRLATLLLLAACGGDELVLRPLSLTLSNLSGRAQKLTVMVFPDESGPTCANINVVNVRSFTSPRTVTWMRGAEKRLMLDPVDAEALTLLAYTEDDTGAALQTACRLVRFADLETPEVALALSDRPP